MGIMARALYLKTVEQTGYYERFTLAAFAYKKRDEEYVPKDWTMDYPQFERIIFEKSNQFKVTGEIDYLGPDNNVTQTVVTTIDQCPLSKLEWIEWT